MCVQGGILTAWVSPVRVLQQVLYFFLNTHNLGTVGLNPGTWNGVLYSFDVFYQVSFCNIYLLVTKMSTYSILCVHGTSLCSEVVAPLTTIIIIMFIGKNNTDKSTLVKLILCIIILRMQV